MAAGEIYVSGHYLYYRDGSDILRRVYPVTAWSPAHGWDAGRLAITTNRIAWKGNSGYAYYNSSVLGSGSTTLPNGAIYVGGPYLYYANGGTLYRAGYG